MKRYKITVNGQSYEVGVEELGGATSSPAATGFAPPSAAPATAPSAAAGPAASAAGPAIVGATTVKAPMPGTVLSFKVSPGQAVKRGDVLLILEAMKMENEIVAPGDGNVASLRVAAGAAVNTGDALVDLT